MAKFTITTIFNNKPHVDEFHFCLQKSVHKNSTEELLDTLFGNVPNFHNTPFNWLVEQGVESSSGQYIPPNYDNTERLVILYNLAKELEIDQFLSIVRGLNYKIVVDSNDHHIKSPNVKPSNTQNND